MKPIHKWLIAGGLVMFGLVAMCCGGVIWSGKRMIEQTVYPTARDMPEAVKSDMPAMLRKLEKAMAKSAPKTLKALAPGLKAQEIAALEAKYNVTLSQELKDLYMWRNGSMDAEAGAEIMPWFHFSSLEVTLKEREEYNKTVVSEGGYFLKHQKTWICVFGSYDGGYFYDSIRAEAEGAYFMTDTDSMEYTFFPSMGNVIAGMVDCYREGIYKEDAEGALEEVDSDKAEAIWNRYGTVHEQ